MTRLLVGYMILAIGYLPRLGVGVVRAQLPLPPTINHQLSTNYFTVTATDATGRRSASSAELAVTRPAPFILGWNPSATPGVTYQLLQGRSSGHETNALNTGTNLQTWWPGPPRTNLVITVTATLTLTNPPAPAMFFALCATTNLSAPFRPIGHISITATNY